MQKLEEELRKYSMSDAYPFHMPGHKRNAASVDDYLKTACKLDITETDGFDNLHSPEGILLKEMQFAANLYKTKETFFSVNGSTGAILAAVSAAAPKGGKILINRSCHISVYHAAALRELDLEYTENVPFNKNLDDSGKNAGPLHAVVITSPTYEGYVRDVRMWAEYAHKRGAVLIVDEAHGAHFSMHPFFPESAARCGADLVIQSLHKTLPALTQTALLHNVSGRVDGKRLQHFLDIYETSSPSYLLMASITSCLHAAAESGSAFFDAYAARLKSFYDVMEEQLQCLYLVPAGFAGGAPSDPFIGRDPGKLLVRTPLPCTGTTLYERLRDEFQLPGEMKGPDYVLLMTSPADTDEGFERLKAALIAIDRDLRSEKWCRHAGTDEKHTADVIFPIPPDRIPLGAAAEGSVEYVPLYEAEGRTAGDYLIVYPPDCPLIIPGEVCTKELLRCITELLEKHMNILGIKMQNSVPFIPVLCKMRYNASMINAAHKLTQLHKPF